MSRRFLLAVVIVILGLLLFAVYRHTPANSVWIPGDRFSIEMDCEIPETAIVGEWITLDANRKSGPWKLVPKSELSLGEIGWSTEPDPVEHHVASSLSWDVEPNSARFSVPTLDTVDFHMKYRQVKFLEPGTYRIRGTTATPAPGASPWYTIVIEQDRTEPGR